MENEKRALRGGSETQHQILLSKHRFELCVGVCRLIVEERGQVPDNWIQLCQTEYLIPFGRRLRGRSCGNYTILTLRELFLIIFSHLQLLLIEPYLRVERILNPRVCHLCKKRMDDWGAGRREWLWEWLEAENVLSTAAKCSGTESAPLERLHQHVGRTDLIIYYCPRE